MLCRQYFPHLPIPAKHWTQEGYKYWLWYHENKFTEVISDRKLLWNTFKSMSWFRLPKLDTFKSLLVKKVEWFSSFIFKTNYLQSHQRSEIMPGFGSISHPSHALPRQTSHLMDQGVKHEKHCKNLLEESLLGSWPYAVTGEQFFPLLCPMLNWKSPFPLPNVLKYPLNWFSYSVLKDEELLEVSRLSSLQNTQSPQHCPKANALLSQLGCSTSACVWKWETTSPSVPSRWCITAPSASSGQHPARDLKITPANALTGMVTWCSDRLLNSQSFWGDVKPPREFTELTGKENVSITSIIRGILWVREKMRGCTIPELFFSNSEPKELTEMSERKELIKGVTDCKPRAASARHSKRT